jgi:bifunctional N-acetylglucosamine-1-phosphate-uridyltransferase/glucosamine-1-phosphate-acetyltransferase GlmU-like protein
MKLSAIYLDGSESIQTDSDGKGLDNRQIFLKAALASPVGTSQFLVTNNQRLILENLGLLPAESSIEIVNPDRKTAGAIASALLPYDLIDESDAIALLPTNSLVNRESLVEFAQAMLSSEHDAGVLLVESQNPNFSYVRMFESKIIEFVEKKVVGNFATTGVFFFRNKDVLVNCARWALVNNQSTNNHYYVAPSLNYLLTSGRSIGYQVLTMDQYRHSSFPTEKG